MCSPFVCLLLAYTYRNYHSDAAGCAFLEGSREDTAFCYTARNDDYPGRRRGCPPVNRGGVDEKGVCRGQRDASLAVETPRPSALLVRDTGDLASRASPLAPQIRFGSASHDCAGVL